MSTEDTEMHGTRKVRENGDSVIITLPKESVEASDLQVGENAMVMTADGTESVVLLPWDEDSIRDRMGIE